MSEWKDKSIDELVYVDPEQLTSNTDENYSFFYIDVGSVNLGHIDYPSQQIKFKTSPSRARKVLRINDILMSTVRPNLKSFAIFKKVSKFNFVASTGFAVLRSKPETDTNFIYHSLFSDKIEKQIQTLVVGSNYPALNSKDIRELLVNTPNFPIQQYIGRILSTCDFVIEKTQSAIAKYKAIKQGMLHDLFTRGIDIKTGKLRPKYEDAPELYKMSKLGWIPKDWEENEVMNYLSFLSYGFTNPMPETQDGPYLITAANVNNGKIEYETCRKTSKEAFDVLLTEKSRPKINDILLTKDGSLGRIALVDRGNLCINQSVAILRPNNLIDPSFLKILLESPLYQKKLLEDAGGSTIKHIYITVIDKMFICVPRNPNEQIGIVQRMKIIENSIDYEQQYLQKLKSIKQGLMGDLLSGKKTVKIETLN